MIMQKVYHDFIVFKGTFYVYYYISNFFQDILNVVTYE